MSAPSHVLTIREAACLIAAKEISPVELVRAFLDRIETLDPQLKAFIHVRRDDALDEAKTAETDILAGRYRGPLHGIPVALKDIIETKGVPTTAASRILENNVPTRDAAAWRRLKDAGAILLGKLETHEFASGGPRRVSNAPYDLRALNPWNPKRYAGGSSNGAAVAVAAGLCMGALGTCTGGSIRIPASYCGVFGFKPTYGRVSRHGIYPVSFSLDHCGPMTWTAEDSALVLSVIAGHEPGDAASIPEAPSDYAGQLAQRLDGLRVGYVRHFSHEDVAVSCEINQAIDTALGVFGDLGADVGDVRLPSLAEFTACNTVIAMAEMATVHERNLHTRARDFSEYTRDRLLIGSCIRAADYIQAQRLRRQLADEFAAATTGIDVLVWASTPTTAPDAQLAASRMQKFFFLHAPVLSSPASLLGLPAAATCCGFDQEGLPIAMQIIGKPRDDAGVLRAAHAYERATPWRDRRPLP